MLTQSARLFRQSLSLAALAIASGYSPAAWAQTGTAGSNDPADQTVSATPAASAPDDQTPDSSGDIVITGFRASLDKALSEKRNSTAAIDSIVAEDIGKFPDSNLAESMQRIPGVALSRGDGGEGRNISVRGLGPGFTRVRINGMEGTSQASASDIRGSVNGGRSFDFNVFPSEIFSSLAVRKTPSADVEEGSLGATVDLKAPKPLDFKTDFVLTATARGLYNEVSKRADPRASLLVAKTFGDGTFGILGSLAYQRRHIREVGYSAVAIVPTDINGLKVNNVNFPFCTPIGYSPVSPSPIAQGNKGATDTMCSTGNPRTGTIDAYNKITALRRPDAPDVPGSGAYFPRNPRYYDSTQDQERIGGTMTLQWAPDAHTDVSLDFLYSRFDVTRTDSDIAGNAISRSVTNNGQPMISVRDVDFDSQGSVQYALMDGMDVRSDTQTEHFISTFKQVNLNFRHDFSDSFQVNGMAGYSESLLDDRERLLTYLDANDTDNFVLDFRNGKKLVGFGFDVSNPNNFSYAPALADGTTLGGFGTQSRPGQNRTKNQTYELNAIWAPADGFKVHVGGQYRSSDFSSYSTLLDPSQVAVQPLPAGTTVADITKQITGLDKLYGNGAPASFTIIDQDKWKQAVGYDNFRYCRTECGASASGVREQVTSGYMMVTFDTEQNFPLHIRGDFGTRYVHTDQSSYGYIPVAAPAGSPYPTTGLRAQVDRSYDDWLPSANVVFDFTPKLLGRLSAARVMSRPELGSLAPTSGVTATTRTGSINNPFLDPIRADTIDAAVEWYFAPGSLFSVAYFHKNISTYIQNVQSMIPFDQLGLPAALLNNTNTAPTEIFTISQPVNTPGGPLNGVEVNLQAPLRFLPGFLKNFGVLANYTHVTSKIQYVLASANGVPLVTTTADLVNLSPNTASATLYYEDKRFSIRTTGSYRDSYIQQIPGFTGSDIVGNKPTFFLDASASYDLTRDVKLILEAQNLTDEHNPLYADSERQDVFFDTRTGRTFTVGASFKF